MLKHKKEVKKAAKPSKCLACGGSGWQEKEVECPVCKGKGKK